MTTEERELYFLLFQKQARAKILFKKFLNSPEWLLQSILEKEQYFQSYLSLFIMEGEPFSED
ncbi:MAG TPA: hypothetical protein VIL78_07220 [Hanamia sp.]